MARFFRIVAYGRAGFDAALSLNSTGARQDRFEQGGLSALEGAHQCNAPGTRRPIAVGFSAVRIRFRHRRLPLPQGRDAARNRVAFFGITPGLGA